MVITKELRYSRVADVATPTAPVVAPNTAIENPEPTSGDDQSSQAVLATGVSTTNYIRCFSKTYEVYAYVPEGFSNSKYGSNYIAYRKIGDKAALYSPIGVTSVSIATVPGERQISIDNSSLELFLITKDYKTLESGSELKKGAVTESLRACEFLQNDIYSNRVEFAKAF